MLVSSMFANPAHSGVNDSTATVQQVRGTCYLSWRGALVKKKKNPDVLKPLNDVRM